MKRLSVSGRLTLAGHQVPQSSSITALLSWTETRKQNKRCQKHA